MTGKHITERPIAFRDIRLFDGDQVLENQTIVIHGRFILTLGTNAAPEDAAVIDGRGKTLLPGLIDSHVHTDMEGLADALKFGVTTELEMNGRWSRKQRKTIAERNDVADLRSPGMGVTPKGGHPSEYMSSSNNLLIRFFFKYPFVNSPEEARRFVTKQLGRGADYIKIFLESGDCIGFPGLPLLDDATLRAAVDEAHRHGKLTIVHVTTADATQKAVAAGVDCLGHLFFDRPATPQLVADIKSAGIFVIPTLVTLSSAFGNRAAELATDKRVSSRLSPQWIESLSRSMNVYPEGTLQDAFATIRALHKAGVDLLAGSDVSEPLPILGGLAHGASLHHELQLFVAAGLTPVEALRSATSVPATRFRLTDRGRIAPGMLADLVLVDGNPTVNISDALSIEGVWHRGEQLRGRL